MITRSSTIVASRDLASVELAGEAIILNMPDATYYGLDTVGNVIWKAVQTPTTVAAVCDAVMAEFDVGAERCEASVLRLLAELESHGLIRIAPAAGDADSGPGDNSSR